MRKIGLACLLTFAFANAFSQDTIYFNKKTQVSSSGKSYRSTEMNIFKIAPLAFIWGYIPVYYERQLNSFLSIQGGVGITTRNYFKGWVNNIGNDDNNFDEEEIIWNVPGNEDNYNLLNPYDYKYRKANIGYYLSIQPKIYIDSDGMDGSYIGVSADYYHYANQHKKVIANSTSDEPKYGGGTAKEHEKFFNVMVNFGTQSIYDRIAVEYVLGIGIRNIKGQHYAVSYDWRNDQYVDGYMNVNKTKLAFNLSVLIGIHR